MSTATRPKTLTRAELAKAQTKVKALLRRVIHDGETVVIHGDDDKPVAVMLPYQRFVRLNNMVKAYLA